MKTTKNSSNPTMLASCKRRQRSYANVRRKPLEFQVGDRVMLKVSPEKVSSDSERKESLTLDSEKQQMQLIQDKSKESCMVSFQQLHSHLKCLSNNDLKETQIEYGFKRAFATLFGQDLETFTGTMFLYMDQLQKQLDNEEFQEIGFMSAFKVLETQFQMFIKSRFYLDDEYVDMIRNKFLQYTRLAIPEFRDTLNQHMESVKKSIGERAQHKMRYESRVNERQNQTTEEKTDTSNVLDASSVFIESNGTKSKEQDTSSTSGNDAHVDDAIRPIYDEEPMAEVQMTADDNVFATGQQHTEQPEFNNEGKVDQNAEQCHDIRPLPAKLNDNMTTELSDQSLESENREGTQVWFCEKESISADQASVFMEMTSVHSSQASFFIQLIFDHYQFRNSEFTTQQRNVSSSKLVSKPRADALWCGAILEIPGWTPDLDDQNDEESDSEDEECEEVFKKDFGESDEEVQGENDVSMVSDTRVRRRIQNPRNVKMKNNKEASTKESLVWTTPGFTQDENDVEMLWMVVKSIQEVDKLCAMEASQKAKIKWAIEDDENSKYYHDKMKNNKEAITKESLEYPPGFTPKVNDVENVEMDNQKDNCDGEFGNVNNISDEVNFSSGFNTYKKASGESLDSDHCRESEGSRKVYALQELSEKKSLRDYLCHVIDNWKGSVIIMGDFNEVRNKNERFKTIFNVHEANAFNSFISMANLEEVPLGGCSFTWCHRSASKMSKLDRFLMSYITE
ncbi:integrase, catalytic region, zinc finger, CCHC-type containing protein [Tanacetum coccineum]